MDLTYCEYHQYLNHLFIQEFVDFGYKANKTNSTVDALTIIGEDK
jgi:hypothetical protein